MAQKMDEMGTTFNDWVDSVMCHVQTHFRHKSLPTKIEFKVYLTKIFFNELNIFIHNNLIAFIVGLVELIVEFNVIIIKASILFRQFLILVRT